MAATTQKRRSFLSGVSVLTLSALAVKVIGLFYRIPLLRYLGTEGMGYFNTAYELYALFCVISTAGLPVAMSVLISAREAEGQFEDARRVYGVARGVFLVIGVVGTGLLWGLSKPFAALLGNQLSAACMRAIAPTVFLICLSSAYRGYFQGHRNMVPTALSQVIEAAGKLILGLLFAAHARAAGADLPTTAAYAVMGLTVGTAVSVVYLALHKRYAASSAARRVTSAAEGKGCPLPTEATDSAGHTRRRILKALAVTAIPVTLSAGVISLTKCIDLALILRRLQDAGYTAAEANRLYGCYSTLAVPVFNILPSLTTSVALSAVPALSAALGQGEAGREDVKKTALSSLTLTLWVAVPAALGIAVFAEDILSLLFAGQPAAVAEATPWLACLGLSVPAACLVTVTGAMLQAAGKANRPIVSMLLGVGAKTVMAYFLLPHPAVGMMAAPLSSLVCDTVIVAVNLCFIARHAPAMVPAPREAASLFLVPTVLSVLSLGAVLLMRRLVGWNSITPLRTVASVLGVMILYGGELLAWLVCTKHPMITKKKEIKHEQADKSRA